MTTTKNTPERSPLSQLAHDMRTPLHTIKVFLDMVPVPDDADLKKLHDGAKRSAQKLIAVADQLSSLAKSR